MNSPRTPLVVIVIVLVMTLCGESFGQCPSQHEFAAFTASNAVVADSFGRRVSIDGNTAVVAAPTGTQRAVYVFRNNSGVWQEEAILTPDVAVAADGFGGAVAIGGDSVIVGAPNDGSLGTYAGTAYIFQEVDGSWQQIAKLTAADGVDHDHFGNSVAIDGNTAVIGAYEGRVNGTRTGSAYVFRRINGVWQQVSQLTADDGAAADEFGFSVAIDAETILVGADHDSEVQGGEGSAYVFRDVDGTWQQIAKLRALAPQGGSTFGNAVSLSGDTAAIGAYRYGGPDVDDIDSGAAYLFREIDGVWQQIAMLTAPIEDYHELFGRSVSISGDTVVVGADGTNVEAIDAGSVYVFREIGADWLQLARLTASDATAGDVLGTSVCIDGDIAIAGAPDSVLVSTSGTAYLFDVSFEGPDCNGNNIPDNCDIASFASIDCDANGIPDECDIANGTREDCNGNGIPDLCDTADESFGDGKLVGAGSNKQDLTGGAVAIDGDSAVVGAFHGSDIQSGVAYVFSRSEGRWQQAARLLPSVVNVNDSFGISVSISGITAIIGSPDDDDDGSASGSAYVFRNVFGNWYLLAKLRASDGAAGDRFGRSVAVSGSTAVVAASNGSAYVFRQFTNSWWQIARLVPSDSPTGFAATVAIDGQTAVVAAWSDNNPNVVSGSIYVFREISGTWQQIAKLIPDGAMVDDQFGSSLSLRGDLVVAGAPDDNVHGFSSGSAYVFREVNGAWQQEAKLDAPDGADQDRFGSSVSVEGETVVVGAPGNNGNGSASGRVYVFRRTSGQWQNAEELTAMDTGYGDQFGAAVSIDHNIVVAGATGATGADYRSGAAYIFVIGAQSSDCNANSIPDDCEPGNFDGDACITPNDIAGFVNGLLAPDPNCASLADTNQDGVVNSGDIAPFVAAVLAGDGCP